MHLTATQYTIAAYGIGLGLMWGYTAVLWIADWTGSRRAVIDPSPDSPDRSPQQ